MILEPELKKFQEEIRSWVEAEIAPQAKELDEIGKFPFDNVKKLAQRGLLGVVVPQEYGGLGKTSRHFAIVIEELARVCGSTCLTVAAHNSLAIGPILKFGNETQKKKYLPDLASGRKIGAFGLTESEAGSDAGGTKTFASLNGNYYSINGSKCFTTNGSVADTYVITARTKKEKDSKSISSFIVERDSKGFSVGKTEKKMGLKGSDTATIIFEEVKVPKENLLGQEGEGFKQFLATLDSGRIGIGAMAVGLAQAALEESLKFAKTREQFDQPIANFQAIQWKLADMATQIEAARLMVHRSAYLKDQGKDFIKQASMAKLFASEVGRMVTYQAIQILGGYGFMSEYPVERFYRDVKLTEIGEGTSEIQRLVIFRQLLKEKNLI
ncbi:MAG: hypothetical protein RBG1_1C00001G1457 [candidate division Zixibacteria bacterium RBG-1]|nr:MAG: hypothetical protein RBG1_1C00001G1457 [candidate division Zixibacteria bacterium RBG-1]OGC85181.1 MAG: acyl-CoA dehydrogenase [candidate division Zixibacteria bacterium RBG_19FT_COMBO_42_43]